MMYPDQHTTYVGYVVLKKIFQLQSFDMTIDFTFTHYAILRNEFVQYMINLQSLMLYFSVSYTQ